MQLARTAVGEWGFVVQLVRSDDLVPERWQVFMDLCQELQLTPVLRLATTFATEEGFWVAPPRDDDGSYQTLSRRYASFVAALDWPTERHFIIVGNEPNHGNEWSGRPDPEAYARFLIDVSAAIRAVDANARILNAGFDPYTPHTGDEPFIDGMLYVDEESFLDGMVAAYPAVFDAIDVWASHPYPQGPLTAGPWTQSFEIDLLNGAANPNHVRPPAHINNRGINGYEWELYKLATYGVAPLPVMITETGWRHSETTESLAQDAGPLLPQAEVVGEYLDLALHGNDGRYPKFPSHGWTPWLEDERVLGVSIFALNGVPAEWGHTNLLILDDKGTVQGAYAPFHVLAVAATQPSARSD